MIMSLFVFAIHSNVQPYQRIRTNVTESIYLFVLCILAVVQIMEDQDNRSEVTGCLLVIATIHSSIICAIKFWRFCKKKCHCAYPRKARVHQYGSFDGNSRSESVRSRTSIDSEVRTKQNLFDSIFASSGDTSNNNDSSERF